MENKELKKLLDQYLGETIDPSDIDRLFDTLQQESHKEEWLQFIDGMLKNNLAHGLSDSSRLQQVLQTILAENSGIAQPTAKAPVIPMHPPVRSRKPWLRYMAAACILFLVAVGVYRLLPASRQSPHDTVKNNTTRLKNDLPPGTNKAVLTLADGSIIMLDSVATGPLAQQGNTNVLKVNGTQLAYSPSAEKLSTILYNTVSTPRGGQYQLVLADGTKVWLNAASSLRFPTSFAGDERTVQLTGEAYFEVAHQTAGDGHTKRPFLVQVDASAAAGASDGMTIEVLGTHFNVNAYSDETEIKTTLLEGSVKICKGSKSATIHPGQQAQLNKNNGISVLNDADIQEVMAWKNGNFRLKAAGIQQIMRQVARWYDVDVYYEGGEPKQVFYGTIPRNVSAVNLFKVLEEAGGVHFKIEGRKVTVLP